MIGKWHLGWDWHKEDKSIDFSKPVVNGPNINGFDYYYGHCGSLDMPPYVWVDGRVTAVPDREGVTARIRMVGIEKILLVRIFIFQKCFLICLISLLSTLRHAVMPNKGILFSLFSCTPHTNVPVPFRGAVALIRMRIL